MKLHFYAGKCLPIHAKSLEERPLGGTETALIRLTEILHQRGHEVKVFTSLQNPPASEIPYVFHQEVLRGEACDAFIFLKEWWPALFNIPTKASFYWTGDSFDQYVNFGLGDHRIAQKIDHFLAVSDWQAKTLCKASGFPAEKAYVIKNGIHWEDFKQEAKPKNKKRLIHSSSPYRGLALVPDLYQKIQAEVPDVELHIYSGLNIYDTDKAFQGPQVLEFNQIRARLEKLPNVHLHGNVTQSQLAKAFLEAGLLFYPNVFTETSCISAMEAMAGACPVISSHRGALPETVGDGGILISGDPTSEAYSTAFIEATLELLRSESTYDDYSARAQNQAKAYTWEAVADRFETLLNRI